MLKRLIFLLIVVLAGCSAPPPKEKAVKTDPNLNRPVTTVKPEANYWPITSYAIKKGETEARKFVRFVTDGTFTDSSQTKKYMYAEVIIDKKNAGIFLHKLKKSNPAAKFTDPVQIKMTNSYGKELNMTSSKSWNSSGGILIERNNNDYSQFRIFLLQSKGTIPVDIRDSGANSYNFNLNVNGFSDSFTRL